MIYKGKISFSYSLHSSVLQATIMGCLSRCQEPNCGATFNTIKLLRKHLILVHNQSHEPESINEFDTEEEYQSWLDEIQIKYSVIFCHKNDKFFKGTGRMVKYFQCNRSGFYKSQGTKKTKKINYRKINDHCTCTLSVTRKNGHITTKFFATHYNNSLDNSHKIVMPVSKSDVQDIVTKINLGVSLPKIKSHYCEENRTLPKEDIRAVHLKKYKICITLKTKW